MASKRTIKGTDYSNVNLEMPSTAVAIKPGMLLEYVSSTGLKVQAHATAGGNVLPLVAVEDELQGKTTLDAYAATAGTKISCWIPTRGCIANLRPAHDVAIAVGDPVESVAAGEIQTHVPDIDSASDVETIYGNQIIGYALEAHSAVASDGAEDEDALLIAVRIA